MKRVNIIALFLFLGVVIWIFTFKPEARDSIQNSVMSALSPFIKTGDVIPEIVRESSEPVASPEEMQAELGELRQKVAELTIEESFIKDIKNENIKLRAALKYVKRAEFELIPARVVNRNASSWWTTVVVNKGRKDGVLPESPVLTRTGLAGKTTNKITESTAEILLLTDEKCQVAAKVVGTTERGILMGERGVSKQEPMLRLKYLGKRADVELGRKVYSSGDGGLFPTQILLGSVTEFHSRETFGEAIITPAVDFHYLEHVFIIRQHVEPVDSEDEKGGGVK